MMVFAKIARLIRPFNSYQYYKELERISKFVKECFGFFLLFSFKRLFRKAVWFVALLYMRNAN